MSVELNENLTLKDLSVVLDIMSVAVSRGAFRLNELKLVGETADRVTAYVNAQLAETKTDNQEVSEGGEEDSKE